MANKNIAKPQIQIVEMIAYKSIEKKDSFVRGTQTSVEQRSLANKEIQCDLIRNRLSTVEFFDNIELEDDELAFLKEMIKNKEGLKMMMANFENFKVNQLVRTP